MSYVRIEQRMVVTVLREDVTSAGPEGWVEGEGFPEEVFVERSPVGIVLKFEDGGDHYLVPAQVIEAVYDLWQEVPVGAGSR